MSSANDARRGHQQRHPTAGSRAVIQLRNMEMEVETLTPELFHRMDTYVGVARIGRGQDRWQLGGRSGGIVHDCGAAKFIRERSAHVGAHGSS